jgi:hypothetical protein
VNWWFGYGNSPDLNVLVDRMPKHDEWVYECHPSDDGYFLYSEIDGVVRYLFGREESGRGALTGEYKLDGESSARMGVSKLVIRDGWSSRAGVINGLRIGKAIMDVGITSQPDTYYHRGGCFWAGAITLDLAMEAAKIAQCHLVKENRRGEWIVIPSCKPFVVEKPDEGVLVEGGRDLDLS